MGHSRQPLRLPTDLRQRRKHKKSQGGQEKKKIQRGGALIERDVEINPRERLYELPYPFSIVCIILFEVLKYFFFHPVSQISPLREYSGDVFLPLSLCTQLRNALISFLYASIVLDVLYLLGF